MKMKAKDVEPGLVFKYAKCNNPVVQQSIFIRLIHGKVVNVANWIAAVVDDNEEVEIMGMLKLVPCGSLLT